MAKRWLVFMALPLVLGACGGGGSTAQSATSGGGGVPAGEITVLTNRTDIVGTDFAQYAADFAKKYPGVTVKFQAVTDYEGEVKIRLNTKNYGDVLLIPNGVAKDTYAQFFAPLGKASDLAQKYNWIDYSTVGDAASGIPTFGNASGFVYNRKVWAKAGLSGAPTSVEEMLADLQAIKDKAGATPLYTNYKDGWPLTQWTQAMGGASCSGDVNNSLATDKAPWSSGKDLASIDSLLFDAVSKKLTEADPTTTNWEESKNLLATGRIGMMYLGSWAITQMQDAAKKAGTSPDDIGYLPLPSQVGGKFCAVSGPDYFMAINKNSDKQAAARAWIDWFAGESGFAAKQGAIAPLKGAKLPSTLGDFDKLGVSFIEMKQDQAALVNKIDLAAEVGLLKPDYRRALVDVARGAAAGSLDSVLSGLNSKWANGMAQAGS